ncbi:efflux RND transporter periplasmic adaptor subunit [Polaromonas sp.]|uniref:efflux RND transporter periplasmic adaptor subunit n=1 Tax=Polaromonas sp. TaxID=1869339 RepID=UPI002730D4E2|nr:efflux RND transporter periplasmic adaptor subunit [Polaromonas sp.]MDP1741638.1 efflux RND transporter periplasmic adaptor subunit [Polaromonas sp.]
MTQKKLVAALLATGLIALLGAGAYGLYTLGMQRGMQAAETSTTAAPGAAAEPGSAALPQGIAEGEDATRRHISAGIKAGDTDPANGQRVLYYHDPMVPGNKFDKPAKSPFMDMMLVPVYAGGDTDQGKVTVSPRTQQNLGVRTAPVTEGTLSPEVAAVGSIAFNERDQVIVQARAAGYVERLHVRATLDSVVQGQPLAELYVPEWVAAQEEYVAVSRMQGPNLAGLVDGARQRMRQAGMSETQIAAVQASGKPSARSTLVAPISGVVTELAAREGMTVMPGATLFRINGLSTVWANAEVPESQAAALRPGARVQARSPAVPGMTFSGKVQAILPEVNPGTRTIKARLELANPGARLVPGMFVQMQLMDSRVGKVLLIPTEAVIQTGKRSVVLLAEKEGRFRPVEVEIGIESGGQTEITKGLQAGQQVVVSSQFLIDSEASLKGVEARLNDPGAGAAASAAPRHLGEAKVDAVDGSAVTLTHGPIASLKWGAMTMDFKLPATGLPRNVRAGDAVTFEFYMNAEGLPQLTGITPMTSATAPKSLGNKP